MAANTRLLITELDFDTILANETTFMQGQSVFQDYNFTASGLQVLLKQLAYNTHYMAYYANMLSNEFGISTALVRDNINRSAKALNYVPFSMTSPSAFVNVIVTPPANTISIGANLLLPRYTTFQSQAISGQNFTYVTTNAYTASYDNANNVFNFQNVQLNEGEVVNYTYVASTGNPRNSFNIPNANIDTTTLIVNVTENTPSPSITYPYAYCTDVSLLDGNSRVYFLEGSTSNTYNIYFGDGILGKQLIPGDSISTTYLVTYGPASNMANNFTCMSPIGGYGNVVTQAVSSASGGTVAETNDSIKFNAPLAYTTQNRAITVADFAFLLKRDFSGIGSISVWGGDQNIPPVYGIPFISIKPANGNYLTPIQKQQILTILQKYVVPGIVPQIVDPDYTYLLYDIDVNYNPNTTTLSQNQLITAVQNAVKNYASQQLGVFNATYRDSTLNNYILAADPSILGSDVEVFLQKRFFPNLGLSAAYTLNFYTQLRQGGLLEKLYSNPGVFVYDTYGNPQTCFIEENINTYQGITNIVINNPGFNYTGTPTIEVLGDGTGAIAHAIIVNGAIQSIVLDEPGQGYNIATIKITGGGGYNASATPILAAETGILDLYYYTSTNKIIVNSNFGVVNHTLGTVTLNNFNPIDVQNQTKQLTINVKPKKDLILPARNNILIFDPTDPTAISITLIPQII